jgi:subtilisin family serine protease
MGVRLAQCVSSIVVALLTLMMLDGPARAAGLAPALVGQIRALEREKTSRTPAEQKVSSHLLYADRMRRGVPIATGISRLETVVEIAPDGTTEVDIRANVTPSLLDRIEALGGSVLHASIRQGAIRARLPIAAVVRLAERDEIRSISPAGRAFTRKINTSQGDTTHRASGLRSAFGVDGSGISVGVLSDGVDSLASIQGSGDLPPGVTVLPGQAGSGDEGTAMLEIVHDLAPGASLLFATAFTSQAAFADNILALHAAGADVIVDDVGYFAEAVFQDDDVAAAVNTVTAAGVLYFSAAGNGGNLDDGTSGVWEGDFQATTSPIGGTADALDFGGGDPLNEILTGSPYVYTLHWSDPLGGSANDYDLYLVNRSGTVIFGASTNVQDGNDDPFEIVGASSNDKGRKLVVVRKNGAADRFLHLNSNRGRLKYATDGQTAGHPAARDAFSVAAVDVRGQGSSFDGSESVETYSSDGPRRVFYEADGSEITPGLYGVTGGEVRSKPDLTAADCVSTATPGFSTFCGTSAAAPHAAAIAALLLDVKPGSTPTEIRAALASGAVDIEAAGPDRDSGAGIVDAYYSAVALVDCLVDADCNDGSFCNGIESCSAGSCVAGTPVDPDDGVACTDDVCDDDLDIVVHTPNDGACDDGLYCDGVEICDPILDCQPGLAIDLDDGVVCTDDVCDEAADQVSHTPNDGHCDDGLFCDGVEYCDALLDCQAGLVVDPDDGVGCTIDVCDEAVDLVLHTPDDASCGDGLFCDGVESCDPLLGCQPGATVDPDDGVACTLDACDEAADLVTHVADAASCDDSDPCTADSCDAITGCAHAPIEGCGVAAVPASSGALRAVLLLLMGLVGVGTLVRRRG